MRPRRPARSAPQLERDRTRPVRALDEHRAARLERQPDREAGAALERAGPGRVAAPEEPRGARRARQRDREAGPAVAARALGAHVPAVQLDDVPDDRESEPEAAVPPRARAVRLPEALEELGQE